MRSERDFQFRYNDLPLRYEDLPLEAEAQPAQVPQVEDKEVERVRFDAAVISRVEDFFEGVDLSREAIQAPDKLREVETGATIVDTANLDFSDLDSRGAVTLEGVSMLLDGDTFISGYHLASKTIVDGEVTFYETASKHSQEIVETGEVRTIHMLSGEAVVPDGPRQVSTDIKITVFSFKDGRTKSFFPHSAFGQPFPEDLKLDVARQIGVEI